jgi:hypothetical protein
MKGIFTMRFHLKSIVAVFALIVAASPMAGAVDLITNGGFENGTVGQIGVDGSLAGWVSAAIPSGGFPLNFNLSSNLAQSGFSATFGMPPITDTQILAGPDNGNNNGLSQSPDGGNFFGAQVGSFVGPFSQTVGGLTPGTDYELSFYWAEANLTGNSAPTTSAWSISFGSESGSTVGTQIASNGFNGWLNYTQTFTASSASQVLSFSPTGTGTGGFALLDGVSLRDATIPVPEPSTYALAAIASGVMAVLARRRNSKLVKSVSV